MQTVFFQVLQQRTARTVHDALGYASGARGVHDIQRVVEGERRELHGGNRVICRELGHHRAVANGPVDTFQLRGFAAEKRHHHDGLKAVQL